MKEYIFEGDFLEIGKQKGTIYRQNGMDLRNVRINQKLFQAQLDVYQAYYPELIEELEGIVLAGNFDKNKLIYTIICDEIPWYTKKFNINRACTIFGHKNHNGTFVGRTYDWVPFTEKNFGVYKVLNPQRNSFFAVTDMRVSGEVGEEILVFTADDAINDKGLYIGYTFATCDKWSYGLSYPHMIKLIAETCSTVEESLEVFENVPLCCPKNFFIADKNGDMAVVEHTSKRFKVRYPQNNVLIITNHYVDPELMKEDIVLDIWPRHSTFIRYYEALREIYERNGEIDGYFNYEDIMKIIVDRTAYLSRDWPPRTRADGVRGYGTRTIWSLALEMQEARYKIYWDLVGKPKSRSIDI